MTGTTKIRDVLVRIVTDNSGLEQGLDSAKTALKGFAVAAGAALGAATAAFGGVTMAAIRSSQEIERFAKISNATTTEFQRFAAAAKTAGIESQEVADVFKDVNDRVGDFLSTGAGPMADFFEKVAPKVGVTADQFRKLSGPQALQLYIDSLQKAGASQQEMTFYLEAMAGNSTRLLPLLVNNGAELNRLADAAQRAGAILSEETLVSLQSAKESVDQINASFTGFTNQLVAAVAPALAVAAANFQEMSAQGGPIAEAVDRISLAFSNLAELVSSPQFIGAATSALTTMIDLVSMAAEGMVFLSQNMDIATAAVGALSVAVAVLGGPLTLAAKLAAAAGAGYLLMGENSKVAEDGAYNVAAAEAALIGELNVFSQSASPAARNESRQRVISLKEQAVAALATAEAELALASALQNKRLAEAPDWIKNANADGVLNIPEYDAANAKVNELTNNIKNLTHSLKELDASGGSGGTVSVTPLPEVEGYGAGIGPPTGVDSGDAGAGGTGGEAGGLTQRLEALETELATERELLAEWYEERQLTLEEALEARQLTEEEYREQRERLEQEHAERMAAIDDASMQTKLGVMKHVFGGLEVLMDAGNKKLFNIGKAAALANAAIEGYEAAVSSFKHGAKIGGPALGAVYAGISLVRTAAMIAKISSQRFGSGSSGGSAGGGSVPGASASTEVNETRTANINFYGGFQPTQETIGMIARGLNDWLGDGGVLRIGQN